MARFVQRTANAPHAVKHMLLFGRSVRTVAGLSALSLSLAGPATVWGAGDAEAAAQNEESVLVATRVISRTEAASSDASPPLVSDEDALEPISQTAEHKPDLALTAGESGSSEIGGTLAEIDVHSRTSALATEAPENTALPKFEPVKFQGMLVGKSTRAELISSWGQPVNSVGTPEGNVLSYKIHPFEAVEVLVGDDQTIAAIKIALASPLEATDLAQQLALDQFRPATVKNEEDEPLGQVFPERGVLFMFEAADSDALAADGKAKLNVSHVVVQPIEASGFAMRAENQLDGPYEQNIADLKTAIEHDSDYAHAHILLAKIYLATGQAEPADVAAAKACELEPGNALYQLCRGETQLLLGEYDTSVLTVRAVLDRDDISPIENAQALYQLARLATLGDAEIASRAVTLLTRSIEIADTVATSPVGNERRIAKRLLVDAHLAMAEEIARQAYNEKVENLSLWVGRASGLAEDFITSDDGSIELRLLIAQRTLGALATFRPTLDPAPWVEEAEEAAETLLAETNDELWQTHVKWELGIAYLNALRVEHVRRETATALEYGQKAVDCLATGAVSRQAVHSSEQLVGQLYFQMGAVHAVHNLDHAEASQWYDKADQLLTGPRPISELYSPRREGEMLVSMGVTYWQLGEQARALKLTQSGVNLVEMAVEDGILAKDVLAVPYGNLAAMYKQIGERANAAKYSELAKNVASPISSSKASARTGRTVSARRRSHVQQTNGQRSTEAGSIR